MITLEQIKLLKSNLHNTVKLTELLLGWEQDLQIKELKKQGSVKVIVTDAKQNKEEVIGITFMDDWCFHKSPFGLQGYTITHIPSAGHLARGKLKNIKAAINYMKVNFTDEMKRKVKENQYNMPFKYFDESEVKVAREIQRHAREGY